MWVSGWTSERPAGTAQFWALTSPRVWMSSSFHQAEAVQASASKLRVRIATTTASTALMMMLLLLLLHLFLGEFPYVFNHLRRAALLFRAQ